MENSTIRLLWLLLLYCLLVVGFTTIVQNQQRKHPNNEQFFGYSQSIKAGIASWYSNEDYPPGTLMANMEVFDDTKFTCASWDYKLGTLLKVTRIPRPQEDGRGNVKNDVVPKSVVVLVTDRGPAKYLVEEGRILDLSKASFEKLAPLSEGLITVSIEQIEK